MHRRRVAVGSAVGLHARPAALIAAKVASLDARVTLAMPGGAPVDAASALMIMTLGAGHGDTVEVAGEDEVAVAAVADLVGSGLGGEPPRAT
jgi:phosphocarrier protein HPr